MTGFVPNWYANIAGVNVKTFGAIGDGVTDDRAAIQAAVNWTSNPNRGVIVLPPGNFNISGPIILDDPINSFILLGSGEQSVITGNFNDFLVKRQGSGVNQITGAVRSVQNLRFANGHATGGGLMLRASIGASVTNNIFSANRCLDMSFCQSSTVQANNLSSGGNSLSSYGMVIGENGLISGCDITGFAKGIAFGGVGLCIDGCRFEVNDVGISCGDANDGVSANNHASGFSIRGGSFESNGIAIDFLGGCGGFIIGGFQIIGFEGAAPYPLGTSVASTTITGTVSAATCTGSINTSGVFTAGTVTGTFQPGTDFLTGTSVPTGTKLSTQLTGTAGKAGTYACSGTPRYALHLPADKCHHGEFIGVTANPQAYNQCIYIENTTNRNCLVFSGVSSANTSTLGGTTWSLPTTAHTAEFNNCDILPSYLFAGLPSGANLRVGDRYFITDSNQSSLGLTAAGGGTTKGYVVWNGTNWTLMSK